MKQPHDEFKPAKLAPPRPPGPARSRSRRKDKPREDTSISQPQQHTVSETKIQTIFTKESRQRLINRHNNSSDNLSSSQNSDTSQMASLVFTDYDEVFDEIDALNPHEHEGGDLIDTSSRSAPGVFYQSTSTTHSSFGHSQASLQASLAASARSGLGPFSTYSSLSHSASTHHYVPTDYDTLMSKTKDGSLAEILQGYDEKPADKSVVVAMKKDPLKLSNIVEMHESASSNLDEEALENLRSSITLEDDRKRDSVVGGKEISDMSLEEQADLLQRSARSLFKDEEQHEIKILSSVDWSSLNKSCKCAKNAFRDSDYSGQMVVKNMFLKNLNALIAQCNLYVSMNDDGGGDADVEKIAQLTTDTKRALRFGMSSLSPPREDDSEAPAELSVSGGSKPKLGKDFRDDVERYRSGRRFRQELQDAAVKSEAEEEEHSRLGLHLPLVDIILGTKPRVSTGHLSASIQKDQYTIQILAARMLCNIVTDNPMAAEIVLMDVPFGPNNEESDRRMSMPYNGDPLMNNDIVLCFSDLITATAKLGSSTDPEREALAAVAAALHNLLASLETRDSLIELDNELKRREHVKSKRARAVRSRRSSSFMGGNNSDDDLSMTKPLDAGFDAVYNRQLMNALLRNILPAHQVMMEARSMSVGGTANRPKFQAPKSANDQVHSFGDTSDSATEWISLIIERMASRGLLPQMFQSAGGIRGKSVTPEQVVLTSCIRQAVDDYHSARGPMGETGEFGRRRLSIAAKSAGVTTLSRPHPLWGRVNEEFGGGNGAVSPLSGVKTGTTKSAQKPTIFNSSVVPNLLFLANEVERMYTHTKELDSNPSEVLYDGEISCTLRVIEDIRDILGQCMGRHDTNPSEKSKLCTLSEARSVLGRETSIITHCLCDLANLLDSALARNTGKNARDLYLSAKEQHSAIVSVRLIANMVYQCRYNQDILRIIPIPSTKQLSTITAERRVGIHVVLSTTSLAPTCLSLREWCIVAIRNAVENNEANAEAVRLLEAQNTLGDTPELRRMGMKVNMDAKGKVRVQKRDGFDRC
ncbi:hypothetical protein ACHAWO_011145 [Cyclotella atomus]|uniref:Ataxin-10 domain-containing protein n=1 Tax=Cyclotella atomus TaxID=382360 RepID=A0ABD3QDJ0_9STRA